MDSTHDSFKMPLENIDPSAENIAKLFESKGLVNTSKWILHALNHRLSDPQKDREDILNSLRVEIRTYRSRFYSNPNYKEESFENILSSIILALVSNPTGFNKLTKELARIVAKIIDSNKLLDEIAEMVEGLEPKSKFYMICFYYLILWEGSFSNVKQALRAMKCLEKKIEIVWNETGSFKILDKKEKINYKNILPKTISNGNHDHLRNAIAHAHFRFLDSEEKMEFWDIFTYTPTYSMKPTKLSYEEFSKFLLEINLFCEIFGFINLVLIALEDISSRYS